MDLAREVVAYIRREALLEPGDTVVTGVSGGPDSLCLLHILWTHRAELGIEIHVAHLNHQLRGAAAEADAQFVAELASRWELPHTVEAHDVGAVARQQKMAIEEAARRTRYAFLLRVAQRIGAARIAVGHNADDQTETVIMHWLRGSGLAGLRGMLPATPMSALRLFGPPAEGAPTWLVRPLLETARAKIECYCQAQGLKPRFDRSNLDTTLFRNKLRRELIPYLEREFKPGFSEIVRRSARVIRDDYDLLRRLRDQAWRETVCSATSEAVVLRREAWRALHPALQRGIIRRAVGHLRHGLRDLSFQHVEAALRVGRTGEAGAQATLPAGIMWTVGYDTITLAGTEFRPPAAFPALQVAYVRLNVPGVTPLPDDGEVTVRLIARDELPAGWAHNADPWRAYLDIAATGTDLALRRRQEGDRFCPLGLGGQHKLVSELLINDKVPAPWRDKIPLLVRGDGEIMWVCGQRIDERARVGEGTSQVLVVQLCTGVQPRTPEG